MSDTDWKTLGARIRGARTRAGLNQTELAERVPPLDRTAISKIEAGTRRIGAMELSDIALALGVPMSSFFREPLPAIVSHRSTQDPDTAEPKIDRLLENLTDDVELVQELTGFMALDASLSEQLNRTRRQPLTSDDDAETLAKKARELLGIEPGAPITDLVSAVAGLGLLAFAFDLGVDTADAATVLLPEGGVSVVNSHYKVGRRRLALAHELGHYLVADDYTVDWRVSDQRHGMEARIDRFARALLLPKDAVRTRWQSLREVHELREAAVLVASEFRVDMSTLARRLEELGTVDAADADLIREVRTRKFDIVEFGLQVPTDMEGTEVPVPFQKAVFRLVQGERIGRERALGLLRDTFTEEDLPPRRARRRDEIWEFVS